MNFKCMTDTYNEHEYEVRPIEKANGATKFVLYVNQEKIISASELEQKGIKFENIPNWTIALETFAREYIDTGSKQKSIENVKYHYPSN